ETQDSVGRAGLCFNHAGAASSCGGGAVLAYFKSCASQWECEREAFFAIFRFFRPGEMSNRTMPLDQDLAVNFTLDIGDGPLAQSILALSSSSVLSTCLSYLGYCV